MLSHPTNMLRILILILGSLSFLAACAGNSAAPEDELVSLQAAGFVQAEGIT